MESGGTLKFHFLVVKSFLVGAKAVEISVPVSSPFCLRLCLLRSTAGNTDSSETHTTPTSKAQVNSHCLSEILMILNTRNKWHPSFFEIWTMTSLSLSWFFSLYFMLISLFKKNCCVTSLMMFVWKVIYRYPFTPKNNKI